MGCLGRVPVRRRGHAERLLPAPHAEGGQHRALIPGPPTHNAGLVAAMSLIWAASIYFYASSTDALGHLGTAFGWPIFIGLIVVTSNVWGPLLGRWRRPPARSVPHGDWLRDSRAQPSRAIPAHVTESMVAWN